MKHLLILTLLLISLKSYAPNKSKLCRVEEVTKEMTISNTNTNSEYERVVNFIKHHEGFRAKPYLDVNGYATIGYGCIIKYSGKVPDSISKHQASTLLRKRFNKDIANVKIKFPQLRGNQILSVAHMCYAFGIGRVIKENLIQGTELDTAKLMTIIPKSRKFSQKAIENYKNNRRFEIKLFYKL